MASKVDLIDLLGGRRRMLLKLGLQPKGDVENKPVLAASDDSVKTGTAVVPRGRNRRAAQVEAMVRVLRETGAPMRIGDITKAVLERGYWSGSSKNAASSLRTALHREIFRNGDRSRFRQVARGLFTLADDQWES